MPDLFFDRVQETTATTGTGPIVLGGASAGFRAFGAVYGDAAPIHYCYIDPVTNAWEVARGVYSASSNSISRGTLEASSTGGFLNLAGSTGAYVFGNVSAAQLQALTAGSLSISTTYTASGAIAVTDRLALINTTSNAAMTLAAPTTNGQRLKIKRFGSGAVTVTLSLDGASGAVITASSASGKECISLIGIVSDPTVGTTWLSE